MLDKKEYFWIEKPRSKYELEVARQNYKEFLSYANMIDNPGSFNNYCELYGITATYNDRFIAKNNKHSNILDFWRWLDFAGLTDKYLSESNNTKYDKLYNDYIANFYN